MSEDTPATDIRSPERLVLVENNHDAQCLIATWTKAWEMFGESKAFTGTIILPDLKENDEFTRSWGSISGVDPLDIERLTPMLFVNEILLPEGQCDKVSIGWVRSRMVHMVGNA